MIQEAFDNLIGSYLASKHRKKVDKITKAFNFAKHAHSGVRRLSGEPYIMHPLAVAQIVCSEIGLGSTSICAALLHDVVEDTDYTVEDIENMFDPKIAQIVDGLTKISGGIFGDHASAQAENFKKLLLTMSDDIRVILIKIADRLHNMRTLGSQPVNKQYKIAGETLYIYAPLSHRLGLNSIKTELEDLSFKYEHPEEYAMIEKKLEATRAERDTVFDEFTAPIREKLDSLGLKYEIKQRIKSPYSIWNKMQNKHVTFEEIYDILAVRVIFEPNDPLAELNECFNIYVGISKIYKSHPDRLRDWVSRPKANGYQALHVTLMSNKGEWIEVQIRSRRMDEIAEKGFAAHWKYKDGDKGEEESENELDKWLTTIKEILDDPQPDAMDFLDTIKLNLYADEVFVFTPKGDIRTMPAGSTVLDFAFSVHTFVGSHCIGAKVNHKLEPITYKLQSGDQIEVLTSKTQHLNREWLDIATTGKAAAKILAILRKEEREARRHGEEKLNAFLSENNVENNPANIDKLCKIHDVEKVEQLYVSIANGSITLGHEDVAKLQNRDTQNSWLRLFSFKKKARADKDEKDSVKVAPIDKKKILPISESFLNSKYVLCDCCRPIPGDAVMGYVDDSNRVIIHKLQCVVAQRLKANHGNHIVGVRWEVGDTMQFEASISMRGIDKPGVLNQITDVISRVHNVNIHKLEIECNDGLFESKIRLYVSGTKELKEIIQSLRNIADVKEVARI